MDSILCTMQCYGRKCGTPLDNLAWIPYNNVGKRRMTYNYEDKISQEEDDDVAMVCSEKKNTYRSDFFTFKLFFFLTKSFWTYETEKKTKKKKVIYIDYYKCFDDVHVSEHS